MLYVDKSIVWRIGGIYSAVHEPNAVACSGHSCFPNSYLVHARENGVISSRRNTPHRPRLPLSNLCPKLVCTLVSGNGEYRNSVGKLRVMFVNLHVDLFGITLSVLERHYADKLFGIQSYIDGSGIKPGYLCETSVLHCERERVHTCQAQCYLYTHTWTYMPFLLLHSLAQVEASVTVMYNVSFKKPLPPRSPKGKAMYLE